jgi:hypothetical protein
VFTRISGKVEPEEWRQLQQDLNGRFYLDPMNWEYLRRDTFALIARSEGTPGQRGGMDS